MSQLPNPYLSTSKSHPKLPPYSLLFDDKSRPSLTKQGPAAEADINTIVNRFMQTGVLPTMPPPQYADLTLAPDLTQALQLKLNADAAWNAIPAQVRALVGEPSNFENWLRDADNVQLAAKHGLLTINPPPAPPAPPAPSVAPPDAK